MKLGDVPAQVADEVLVADQLIGKHAPAMRKLLHYGSIEVSQPHRRRVCPPQCARLFGPHEILLDPDL